MRFLRLVWVNLTRKKLRTTLTIGSFMVALLLYGILATLRIAFSGGADFAGVDQTHKEQRLSTTMIYKVNGRLQGETLSGSWSITENGTQTFTGTYTAKRF